MNLASGPEVVPHDQQQHRYGTQERRRAFSPPGHGNEPALKSRIEDCNRGNHDEPLVSRRIEAVAKGKISQRGEGEHRRESDRVERSYSHSSFARAKVSTQRVGGCQQPEDGHQARQSETQQAQAAMQIDAAAGDQRGLRDQQKNPAGEHCAMDVNEQVGERSLEHSSQIVTVCEPNKHRCDNQHSHAGEKKTVEAVGALVAGYHRLAAHYPVAIVFPISPYYLIGEKSVGCM